MCTTTGPYRQTREIIRAMQEAIIACPRIQVVAEALKLTEKIVHERVREARAMGGFVKDPDLMALDPAEDNANGEYRAAKQCTDPHKMFTRGPLRPPAPKHLAGRMPGAAKDTARDPKHPVFKSRIAEEVEKMRASMRMHRERYPPSPPEEIAAFKAALDKRNAEAEAKWREERAAAQKAEAEARAAGVPGGVDAVKGALQEEKNACWRALILPAEKLPNMMKC